MTRGRTSLLLLALVPGLALAGVTRQGEQVILTGQTYRAVCDAKTGALTSLSAANGGAAIWSSGEYGLWQVSFRDGSTAAAAGYAGTVTCETAAEQAVFTYTGAEPGVKVVLQAEPQQLRVTATVTAVKQTVLDVSAPARLRFKPGEVKQLVMPDSGSTSVGIAYNQHFFEAQPQDDPAGWHGVASGPKGYAALCGGPLDQREDREPESKLSATADGHTWLGERVAQRVGNSTGMVNRPSTRAQTDLTLVDSLDGPYYGASRLGGQGYFWRVGGRVRDTDAGLVTDLVVSTLDHLAAERGKRTKVGLVMLRNGPATGSWCDIELATWQARLADSRAARSGGEFVLLETPQAMLDAAADPTFLGIVNPYGEQCPVTPAAGVNGTIEAVGKFVKAGGSWFEVGGYPFYYAMQPLLYLSRSFKYPAAFADFSHLETTAGTAAMYRVQPRTWAAWSGAKNPQDIFVPGRFGLGGDSQGGYVERCYSGYVTAGQTWTAPPVLLTVGGSVPDELHKYAALNGLKTPLSAKMKPALLADFKQAVMLKYDAPAKDQIAGLGSLPAPTMLHFSNYLKGGFDKEYPDHLPPNAGYGTGAELKAFYDAAHRAGMLVMPYTNPTWWCEGPKGPTFEREGDAPLQRSLDGKVTHERYGNPGNSGYTITFWHPAVRAANETTVREFTEDYPVDVLFQDQNGARSWVYDTNPASPSPAAYTEGLLSMNQQDKQVVPLSTECGWDQVAEQHAQLCGLTWGIVPTEGGPSWRRPLSHTYPPKTWTVYPVVEYLASDKCSLIMHDLGQFVTNREVLSWNLGLGFMLTYRASPAAIAKGPSREWFLWLDRLQKSFVSQYVGQPLTSFEHNRADSASRDDAGYLQAAWGAVKIASNLGAQPRTVDGQALAGFGFRGTAPGVVVADLAKVGTHEFGAEGVAFVSQQGKGQTDVWIYGPGEREVTVELPDSRTGAVEVKLDGAPAQRAKATAGVVTLKLPPPPGEAVVSPPPAMQVPPQQRPGRKPAIGILDLGPKAHPTWTQVSVDAWIRAFEKSELATKYELSVTKLTTAQEMLDALAAGTGRYFAIINPYGEWFPIKANGQSRATLAAIRNYVEHGGIWWEVGGYSFYGGSYPDGDGFARESLGPAGLGQFGIGSDSGDVEAPPVGLSVTPVGRDYLGEAVTRLVEQSNSKDNRGLPNHRSTTAHVTWVEGDGTDLIGGYRLNGWGWLCRVGALNPDPEVSQAVVVAVTEHLFQNPPPPRPPSNLSRLWHLTVKPVG